MRNQLRPALVALVALTLITGLLYPLVVTGLAQMLFPRQANGNLIIVDGKPVGSSLIGHPFDDLFYLFGRPS
jgi:K+-transporting ATPase ATPase C chain